MKILKKQCFLIPQGPPGHGNLEKPRKMKVWAPSGRRRNYFFFVSLAPPPLQNFEKPMFFRRPEATETLKIQRKMKVFGPPSRLQATETLKKQRKMHPKEAFLIFVNFKYGMPKVVPPVNLIL